MDFGETVVLRIARIVRAATQTLGEGRAADARGESRPARDAAILRAVRAILAGRANSLAELNEVLDGYGPAPGPSPAPPSADDCRERALIRAIVLALVDGPCEGACHEESCERTRLHPCHLETCLSEYGVPGPGRACSDTPRTRIGAAEDAASPAAHAGA